MKEKGNKEEMGYILKRISEKLMGNLEIFKKLGKKIMCQSYF